MEENTAGCSSPLHHEGEGGADSQCEGEDEDERADRGRLLPEYRPEQIEHPGMTGQLDHPQKAKQPEHAKVIRAQQTQQGRQHGHQIDQREKTTHVAQPAPYRMGELPAAEIDDGPHAKHIFHGKNRGRGMFCDRERRRITVADRLDGLKHHRNHIDDDECCQQHVEETSRPVGVRWIVVKPTT